MRFSSVFIFVFFFLISKASSNCPDSEAQSVNKCWLDYLANFGINSIPANDVYFEADVKYLYNGPSAFYSQCDWVKKRNSCEGPYKTDCENTFGFVKSLNVSISDAIKYLATDAIELWECSDGYNLTLNNYYCILQVNSIHIGEIKTCQDKLFGGLINGVNCTAANDYVNCVSTVYNNYCGFSGKIFGCHWAGISAQVIVPTCSSSLPKCDSNQ